MEEQKPKIVVIAGPNGAGKSTLAPALLRDTFQLMEYVNADTIATWKDGRVVIIPPEEILVDDLSETEA